MSLPFHRTAAILFLTSICATFLSSRAAEPTAPPAPLFGVEGKPILQADFANEPLDDSWKALKGKWEVKDGLLHGEQIPEQKHAAVLRHELKVRDFIATFVFKFDAGKTIKLVVNHDKGHVCVASFWPAEIDVAKIAEKSKTFKQKTGTLDSEKVKLSTDEWHTAIVEVIGDTIVASLDGKLIVEGSHEGINVDKATVDFAANGSTTIKSVKFCEAAAPADLEAAKAKLQALRGKPTETTTAK